MTRRRVGFFIAPSSPIHAFQRKDKFVRKKILPWPTMVMLKYNK